MNSRGPLVSAAELDALLRSSGGSGRSSVDVYMPLRMWFVIVAIVAVALRLLFFTDQAAQVYAKSPELVESLVPYLYFRGWYLLVVTTIGAYSYARGWYPGLVFGGLLLSSAVNFLFDAFSVYTYILAHPSSASTMMLLMRLLLMVLGYQCFRSAGRLPAPRDRWNPLLPWKKV